MGFTLWAGRPVDLASGPRRLEFHSSGTGWSAELWDGLGRVEDIEAEGLGKLAATAFLLGLRPAVCGAPQGRAEAGRRGGFSGGFEVFGRDHEAIRHTAGSGEGH